MNFNYFSPHNIFIHQVKMNIWLGILEFKDILKKNNMFSDLDVVRNL